MGDIKPNKRLLIIDESGNVSALEWCEIKDITSAKFTPPFYIDNTPVHLKADMCTETVISGERGYLYDMPTCMFESAKKTLDFIVADKRRQEIEEIEKWLNEKPLTVNKIQIKHGYAPTCPDEKNKAMYERYKALKPELFEYTTISTKIKEPWIRERFKAELNSLYGRENIFGGCHLPPDEHAKYCKNDVECTRNLYPEFMITDKVATTYNTCLFMAARASGKTEMQRKWIKDNLHLFTTDCPKFIFRTSNLPKLDPNNNSFIKRLENIWINEKKKVVTVKKPDGSVIKVKCDKRDEFDPYVGTALALAYKEFGSKSKFRKYVDEIVAKQNKKQRECDSNE